jgi:hypothetical protein
LWRPPEWLIWKTDSEYEEHTMSDTLPKMPTPADIAERAYRLYERRSREHGYDISDWVRAQQELNEEFKQALKSMTATEPKTEEKRKVQSA